MTKIDRESVDPLHVKGPNGITRRVDDHYFVPSNVQQDPHGAWLAIQNLCAALNEAEARADSAAQEARAVALQEAAEWHKEVIAHDQGGLDYASAVGIPISNDDDLRASVAIHEYALNRILALLDTPTAEALERVQTEERAKGMERAGVILLDHPHWTRWHVLEAIRAEAAAIRAQETDNA